MPRQTSSKKRAPSGDVAPFGQAAVPPLTEADCPPHCAPAARAEWCRLLAFFARDAAPRFLATDRVALTTFCDLWADYLQARAGAEAGLVLKSEEEGAIRNPFHLAAVDLQRQLRIAAVELGLTPASRPRVHRGTLPAAASAGERTSVDKTAEPDELSGLRLVRPA